MSLVFESRVGKKRIIVLPKAAAEAVGLSEGSRIRIRVEDNRIIIEPIRDAVWLSLYGKKIVKITLEELEKESTHRQAKYVG